MGKILQFEEANEMIQTIAEEYGIPYRTYLINRWNPEARGYRMGGNEIVVVQDRYKHISLLGFKLKFKYLHEVFSEIQTEKVVMRFQQALSEDLDHRCVIADRLRQEHATRILDRELRKPEEKK